jgi:hypothetical protein
MRRLFAAAVLLAALPQVASAQWLAAESSRVSISANVGAVNLAGAEDSSPPAGHAAVWSLRVAAPIKGSLSVEAEFTRSTAVEGSSARVTRPLFRERRHDHVAAVYARVSLWRRNAFAVYPVVGVGLVKPTRQLSGLTLNAATGEWNERALDDSTYPTYPHTLALSWGGDAEFGGRTIAVVGGLRAHEHARDVSPWKAARIVRTSYGSVGVRYRF